MKMLQSKNLTLDSREVARMVGKEHKNVLADIRTYVAYMESDGLKSQPNDFFIESNYKDRGNRERPSYQITKKGCEFIAHKLTGQKGTIFTATYINKFHAMESTINNQQQQITSLTKQQEVTARLNNSKVRQANLLLKIADRVGISEYRQILHSHAAEIITGQRLLPLPQIEEKTYSATDVGDKLGVSANKIGRLANEHNLKTDQYGKWFYDKAKHSNKQVESFRYYESVISVLRDLI